MRLLFSFAGGAGHFEPLVPLARGAAAAGHVVAVAGAAAMGATVAAAGFAFFETGGAAAGPPQRIPLRPVDAEREDRVLRDGFAGHLAKERAEATLDLCRRWRPDVVVCDETDFGAMIAAERLGIPHATVLVIAAGGFVRAELLAEPLDALRAEHGLSTDPTLAMLGRFLVLAPFPPSYRDPAFGLPSTAHAIRPAALEPSSAEEHPWLAGLGGRRTVYVTLGTVFNVESGDLFSRVLGGLRDLAVELVVTVGHHIDPEELGPQPANVRVQRYVPQALILPHCDLVVSHGGSGSVVGALAHGRPLVVIPMGADQPLNAARCEALGVGRALDAVAATPASIRAAVGAVLDDPAYGQAAGRMRDEALALPGSEHALALLERLADERRPQSV